MTSSVPRDPGDDDDRTVIKPPTPAAGTYGNALATGTRLGEFEVIRLIGEGGFGIVYLAEDHSLHRQVALKEYMPSSLSSRGADQQVRLKSERHREIFELGLRSFVNEARLLARFDHPSLAKVHRYWHANGTAYMVMPFYEGITLAQKLSELGSPPDEAWLMSLLGPLTQALEIMHAERCYHRDIAPDNILLLADSSKPILLDFGAARQVIGDSSQALTVILKSGYAPPEQYAEVRRMRQGPWTDVYALAAVVHCAIRGKAPPPSIGRLESDSYVPLADCAADRYSPGFLQAIDRALRVRPEERTQSVEAFRSDLGLDRNGSAAASDPTMNDSAALSRRTARGGRKGLWVGVGVVAIALGAAATFRIAVRDGKPVTTTVSLSSPLASTSLPPPTPSTPETVSPRGEQTPAPSEPFSVAAEFDRIVASQDAGFGVSVGTARSPLRIGKDNLEFAIKSSRDGYVYVLLEGADRELLLFFPNSRSSNNRIRAGQTLRLPQPSWGLTAAEPAGVEKFLVIVSQAPRDYTRLGSQQAGYFQKLRTDEASVAIARAFTGNGSVLAGAARCSQPSCEGYGAARFSIEVTR